MTLSIFAALILAAAPATSTTGSDLHLGNDEAAALATGPTDKPQEIWAARCSHCHGKDGSAQTLMAKKWRVRDLSDPMFQEHRTNAELRAAVEKGVANSKMRAFGKVLTDAQLNALVSYIRDFKQDSLPVRVSDAR